MNNQIVPLAFDGHEVRVIDRDGEPLFVLADICKVLDLSNPRKVAADLDEDAVTTSDLIDSLGRTQQANVVTEAGLYEVIFKSRKPEARMFKRWVTNEVIPAIRKTGSYGAPKELTDTEIVHQALQITARQVEQLKAENAVLKPESDAWRGLSRAIGDFVIADAAKIVARVGCKTGPGRLHKQIEHEWNWIFHRGEKKKRVVYQGVIDKGWMVARITSGYIDQITGERKNGTPEPRVTVKGIGEIARRLGGDADAAMAAAREEIRTQEAEASA